MVDLSPFGHLDGQEVLRGVLSDGDTEVAILSFGAITQSWKIAGVPMILGFESLAEYAETTWYHGAIAGRVANRIGGAAFSLGGRRYALNANEGRNQLHGGAGGLNRCHWDIVADGDSALRLSYHSPAGEMGFPEAVDFQIKVSLKGNRLTYDMTASPTGPTPISLAQHSYYTLGTADVRMLTLQMDATHYTPVDAENIPTGEIAMVGGTAFDFRTPKAVSENPEIDHNLAFRAGRNTDAPAVTVTSPEGRTLTLWTDQPGIQVFAASPMPNDPPLTGPYSGLCLEPQGFPNAVNQPNFPSIIATPEKPYRQSLTVEIK